MKINTFISLSALVVISLFVAVSIFVSNFVILDGISSIENDQTIEDALKLKNYINYCEKELDKLTMDWAYWDDTYNYLNTRDNEFLATNFEYSIFEQQQISSAAIFDLQNNFVFGTKAVPEQTSTQELSPSAIRTLSQITALLNDNIGLSGIEGVVQLEGSPHIFAMRKITDTQMHKNPNGVLVLTKLIDNNFITNIEDNILFTVAALKPHQIDKELIDTSVVDIFRIKKFPDSISGGFNLQVQHPQS